MVFCLFGAFSKFGAAVIVAQTLLTYTKWSRLRLYKPCPENTFGEASDNAVRVANVHVGTRLPTVAPPPSPAPQCIDDIPSAHSEPFRLSEISPHKQPPSASQPSAAAHTGTLQQGRQHAMTPMRQAKKRVSMDGDPTPEYHRRKKGKTVLADSDSERRSSDEEVSQALPLPAKKAGHEDQPVTHSETRDSTRHGNSSKSALPSARTKYKPKLNSSSGCKGPTLDAFPYLSSSRRVHGTINKDKGKRGQGQSKAANIQSEPSLNGFSANSRLRQARRTRKGNAVQPLHGGQRSGPISTADLPLIEKQVREVY